MTDLAIRAEALGKEFELGRAAEKYSTMRDLLMRGLAAPARLLRAKRNRRETPKRIWALRDVSFDVRVGEVVGIIGRNGAGKSTLLKVLSRITPPTLGRLELHGRVGSLLEVGTGFHNELTGRENIFLNGAILGMRRSAIARQFNEIVAFADLERFVDTPVKHYSSGMYLRLAFAVAAHMDTDILLVDEVLAVGDAEFQKKCLGKMGEVAETGKTVLLVSHNMNAITDLCQRALWIHDGRLRQDGAVSDVTQAYLDSLSAAEFSFESQAHGLTLHRVLLRNAGQEISTRFRPGEELVVEIEFTATRPIRQPYLIISVHGLRGACFTANMMLDGRRPLVLDGQGVLRCRFKSLPLLPQSYSVQLSVRANDGKETILGSQEVGSFHVQGDLRDFGFRGEYISLASRATPVLVPYEWLLPDGSVESIELTRAAEKTSRVKEVSDVRS